MENVYNTVKKKIEEIIGDEEDVDVYDVCFENCSRCRRDIEFLCGRHNTVNLHESILHAHIHSYCIYTYRDRIEIHVVWGAVWKTLAVIYGDGDKPPYVALVKGGAIYVYPKMKWEEKLVKKVFRQLYEILTSVEEEIKRLEENET